MFTKSRIRALGCLLAILGLALPSGMAEAAQTVYRLKNHPDGESAPPLYGLRLDELIDVRPNKHDSFVFDFDHPDSDVTLTVDDNDTPSDPTDDVIRIMGSVFGGRVRMGAFDPDLSGLWALDFTYTRNIVSTGGDGSNIVVNPESAGNSGTITALFGNIAGTVFPMGDFDGDQGFSFKFNNTDDHRLSGTGLSGPETFVGWGWLTHGQGEHIDASDWLFTGELKPDMPPPPPPVCTPGPETLDLSEYRVEFLGSTYDAQADQTTVQYRVTGLGTPPALSFFTLAIVGCEIVDASPTPFEVGRDPHTGIDGIKWDCTLDVNETRVYTLTLAGDVPTGSIPVGLKRGRLVAIDLIAGPNCECPEANTAPVANDDDYMTDEDAPLSIAAPGVLDNDTDAENDPLTAMLVTAPANGTLTLNADGSFDYDPDPGFSGTDIFGYKANDGIEDSNTAIVTIEVKPGTENRPPFARSDVYGTSQGTTLTIQAPGVLGNDFDADGDPISAVLLSAPANGTVRFGADGGFEYVPNPDFVGLDVMIYAANDGIASGNPAFVLLFVVPPETNFPPFTRDDLYLTPAGTTLIVQAPGVLDNDLDFNGDSLTAALDAGPGNGTLTLNPDGSFTYTPDEGFTGLDRFFYKANDGTEDSRQTQVRIVVFDDDGNNAPIALDDTFATLQGQPLLVPAPGVLDNDVDPDGDALTVTVVDDPSSGTLVLNADGSFLYLPEPGFAGGDSFTYVASDGQSISNVATVTIGVNRTTGNTPPVALPDFYATLEGTPLNVAAPGVLGNDFDFDGDPIVAIQVTAPANGMLTLRANGSFDYAPNPGFSGLDSFTYRGSDGFGLGNVATAVIFVFPGPPNTAPEAKNDAYSTAYDTPLTIDAPGVLDNDTDADDDPLTAVRGDGPFNGQLQFGADGSFTYTPNAGFSGVDMFTYQADDGRPAPVTEDTEELSGVATVTIMVDARENSAPVANDDNYATPYETALAIGAPGVLFNDTDADSDPLMAVPGSGPANGMVALQPDGSFLYTPNAGFSGEDTFTYQADDGALRSAAATVTINVGSAGNTPPVAMNDGYMTPQGTALNVAAPGVLGNDTDAENDALTASLVDAPSNGALNLNADGSFEYVPDPLFVGDDSFTYRANDGLNASNLATVTIAVVGGGDENTPPVANDDAYEVDQDTALEVDAAGGVLANDTDADMDMLTALAGVDGPSHGALMLSTDGSFRYEPDAGFTGQDSFVYRASDGAAVSNLATVTIAVREVTANDPPVARDDGPYRVERDATLNVAAVDGALANDDDPENDPLTAVLVAGPASGTLNFNADGSFTYEPDAGFAGDDAFTYRASDGALESNIATVFIDVFEEAMPPGNCVPGPDVARLLGFTLRFINHTYDAANDITIFHYTLTGENATVALDALTIGIIGCEGMPWLNPMSGTLGVDPATGIDGATWTEDLGGEDGVFLGNDTQAFYIEMPGRVSLGTVEAAVSAGGELQVCSFAGPDCACTPDCTEAPVIAAIANADAIAGQAYAGPLPELEAGDGAIRWSLLNAPAGMTIDPATGQVTWANPGRNQSPALVTLQARNACGSHAISWVVTVLPEGFEECEPTLEQFVDFAIEGNQGGAWQPGVVQGQGTASINAWGLCMTVVEQGDNEIIWVGPERWIDLKDRTAYRVRLRLSTEQNDVDAIPLFFMMYDNFTKGTGRGNTFGGCMWILDTMGGANGIGRPQGREFFDLWMMPIAAETPQWSGTLNDGSQGAFAPELDDVNDIRVSFRLLDLASAGYGAADDSGQICVENITVESFPLECLIDEALLYATPISNATHAASTFGQTPKLAEIDDVLNIAAYQLDTEGPMDRATLIPAVEPFGFAGLYPVTWETDATYRVSALMQSSAASTEEDPVDLIMVNADTATNELGAMHFVTRGNRGDASNPDNFWRSGSPRTSAEAGGPQRYTMFFGGNNATASLIENANRLRPMLDLFNSESIGGPGTGGDPFEVLNLQVARIRVPGDN